MLHLIFGQWVTIRFAGSSTLQMEHEPPGTVFMSIYYLGHMSNSRPADQIWPLADLDPARISIWGHNKFWPAYLCSKPKTQESVF